MADYRALMDSRAARDLARQDSARLADGDSVTRAAVATGQHFLTPALRDHMLVQQGVGGLSYNTLALQLRHETATPHLRKYLQGDTVVTQDAHGPTALVNSQVVVGGTPPRYASYANWADDPTVASQDPAVKYSALSGADAPKRLVGTSNRISGKCVPVKGEYVPVAPAGVVEDPDHGYIYRRTRRFFMADHGFNPNPFYVWDVRIVQVPKNYMTVADERYVLNGTLLGRWDQQIPGMAIPVINLKADNKFLFSPCRDEAGMILINGTDETGYRFYQSLYGEKNQAWTGLFSFQMPPLYSVTKADYLMYPDWPGITVSP